jgi:hypothetical protein
LSDMSSTSTAKPGMGPVQWGYGGGTVVSQWCYSGVTVGVTVGMLESNGCGMSSTSTVKPDMGPVQG